MNKKEKKYIAIVLAFIITLLFLLLAFIVAYGLTNYYK